MDHVKIIIKTVDSKSGATDTRAVNLERPDAPDAATKAAQAALDGVAVRFGSDRISPAERSPAADQAEDIIRQAVEREAQAILGRVKTLEERLEETPHIDEHRSLEARLEDIAANQDSENLGNVHKAIREGLNGKADQEEVGELSQKLDRLSQEFSDKVDEVEQYELCKLADIIDTVEALPDFKALEDIDPTELVVSGTLEDYVKAEDLDEEVGDAIEKLTFRLTVS